MESYRFVVFLQKVDNADIVFEGDDMAFRELFKWRHVSSKGLQCFEHIL